MHKNNKHIFLLVLCLFTLNGCSFFDSSDHDPMYISVDEVSLTTNFNQGAATHAIEDIWVFVDGEQLGVFELPIDVPILDLDDDGISNVAIFAGVRNNGVKSDAIIYPFYEKLEFEFEYKAGLIRDLELEFRYADNIQFEIIEDFEIGNLFNVSIDDGETTEFAVSSTEAATGFNSGHMMLPASGGDLEITTAAFLDPDQIATGSRVFLELDYKNETELNVGLLTIEDSFEFSAYKVVFVTKDDWNKVYIEFTSELADSNIDLYRILLGATNSSSNEQNIYLDNIKLLHF